MRHHHALALCLTIAPLAAQDHVYLGTDSSAYLLQIDIATGDRREFILDDYPRVLTATVFVVDHDGMILISTSEAMGRMGIYRLNPFDETMVGISGALTSDVTELRGDGPPFPSRFRSMVRGVGNDLYVVPRLGGIMAVDLVTGDRRQVRLPEILEPPQDGAKAIPSYRPDDVAMMRPGKLLLADRFEGPLTVDIASGGTRRALPEGVSPLTPRRMDSLRPGVVLHTAFFEDPSVWKLDLRTGEENLFSGIFGGLEAGQGPAMASAVDIAIDPSGRIWIYDVLTPALFLLDENGDRRIISSDAIGEGPPLLGPFDAPILGSYARPIPNAETGWVVQ